MGHGFESDEDLLSRHLAGEGQAFAAIVDRYQRLVCGVCYAATQDWALSEDLAQDTFVAAWHKLDTVREPSRLSAWLCGIARNLSHKARRKARPTVPLETVAEPSSDDSPLDRVIDAETRRVVDRALAQLSIQYREPLVLFYQHAQSAAEVGAALGLSTPAVHQRLSRARSQLEAEVRTLVEASLSQSRPKKGFSAAVLVAVGASVPAGEAAAATKGWMMTQSTWTALGVGLSTLFALGWWATSTASPDPSRAARASAMPSAPPALSAGKRPKTQTASRPPLAPAATKTETSAAAQPESQPRGQKIYETTYAISGVEENWADGQLGLLLSPCFEGLASLHHRFALEPVAGGWKAVQIEGPSISADQLKCLADKLSEFGLDPKPGAKVELEHRREARAAPSAFDPLAFDQAELESGPFLGAADAALTMVVFVTFKCVYCGQMLGTVDQLLEEYPQQLKVVVRPFALQDSDVLITEAAYAAEAQGKFFAFHDAMIADQAHLSEATLTDFAGRAGLDLARFRADLEHRTFREQVEREREEAKRAGVRGVPATILAEDYIMGAAPIETFRAKIDAALSGG